jgi:hypothetical protein
VIVFDKGTLLKIETYDATAVSKDQLVALATEVLPRFG